MLKWTVQQKRHRAAAATADSEPDERDSGSADGSSSRSSSRSNSGDCDGEEQQQVARAPDGSAAGCDCSASTTESGAGQRWAADHRETEPRLLSTADAFDADEDTAADSSAASASFVRRPSIRQPRGRSARPLSLNLETFYACDRAAIPQKAKALLGIDERPRTPIVAAVAAVGQLDGLSMSPKALAVLGITAADQQSQQQQMVQQQHQRQRKSQLRRRSPAGGSLQQINEGSPVCDGPDASSGSSGGSSNAAASGGMANGRIASADCTPAARREVGSRNGSRRDGIDGLSPDSDAGSCRMYDGRAAAMAAASAVRDADRNIRVVYGSPRTGTCHLPPQQQPMQQRAEHLNEAVEVVAARPKVARRRPLKHSRRESPTNCHGLAATSVVEPDDDSSSSGGSSSSSRGVSCDGSAPDRSLQALHVRCGSCTPDSGVGGVQRSCGVASAETDSPSDYDDDDDAVAAWRQPHPLPPPPTVGSCACRERRAMPPTPPAAAALLRVAVSGTSPPLPSTRSSPTAPPAATPPSGTQSDFIDVDVRARPVPLARLPSAAAVACLSYKAPSDRKARVTRGDGRLTPEALCSSSDACRRAYLLPPQHMQPPQYMLPPQHQLRTVTRAPSPVCGGRISPSLGLRHAHSDPVSASWTRTAGDALQTCSHEPEAARWAAVKAAGSDRNERGYHNQQHDRAAERQAAMAAYRKTVHVYC